MKFILWVSELANEIIKSMELDDLYKIWQLYNTGQLTSSVLK